MLMLLTTSLIKKIKRERERDQLTGHAQVALSIVHPVEHVRPALKSDTLQSQPCHPCPNIELHCTAALTKKKLKDHMKDFGKTK